MSKAPSRIGQKKFWPLNGMVMRVVAECPGWVFVMPPGDRPGRPLSISAAAWDELANDTETEK